MKRKMPRRLIAVMVAGLVVICLVVVVFSSMNGVPEFYRQALAIAHPKSQIQGQLFERRLVELSNRMRLDESWSAVLTESQINGWLAADLLEKFPDALPDSISQPRVSMSENEIRIAFQFRSKSLSGVIQIQGDLFATDVENQIAFRIATVRSGIIPIPISWWGDRLWSHPCVTGMLCWNGPKSKMTWWR